MGKEIKFKDLSTGLKIPIVIGWIVGIYFLITFLIGFMLGIAWVM